MPPCARVFYVHWNEAEARARVNDTRVAGFALEWATLNHPEGKPTWKSLRTNPPAVFLIDLARLPAHGRAVAVVLRENNKTRFVPIVFVGGDRAKVAKIRTEVPDAIYCEWGDIENALSKAITTPPPLLPRGAERVKHKPLAAKLGLTEDMRVWLDGAPEAFVENLRGVPKGVTFKATRSGRHDLAIVFVEWAGELGSALDRALARLTDRGAVWVAWPKKSGGARTDMTPTAIGVAAKPRALSGYKICGFDERWAGVRLGRKRDA
jgi:hypothetical protein